LESPHCAAVEHGTQPAIGVYVQVPASQVAVVHALVHSAALLQSVHPEIRVWKQPVSALQPSVVQTSWSSQSGGGAGWQPAAPAQTSTPLHALPSPQSVSGFSSAAPSQSLSMPSQISPTWRRTLAIAVRAFVARALAVLSAADAPPAGEASASLRPVSDAPGGSEGARPSSGCSETTVHVTPGSSALTSATALECARERV
jgi:hypothetical protein